MVMGAGAAGPASSLHPSLMVTQSLVGAAVGCSLPGVKAVFQIPHSSL